MNLYSSCRAVFSERADKPLSDGKILVPSYSVLYLSQLRQDSARDTRSNKHVIRLFGCMSTMHLT